EQHALQRSENPAEQVPGTLTLAGADPAEGERVFFENLTLSCNRCHALGGKGGGVGPSLDDVGARLNAEELLESILDPNAQMAESWPAPVSAMPALRSFMSTDELNNLVAFLLQQKP
ncbi:MAG: cytochrome c, partial [Planctomycetes bacterium]|nr:cytochrome c [Planctomycetota bacterium]